MNNVNFIKARYPAGTRIKLIKMNEEARPVEPGSYGTVSHVDDIGTIHVNWDNGRMLGLVVGVDEFTIEGEE